jgi:diacylglycerol kinase (ATP)
MDLGKVNGRRFVLMMGAGIDAMTVRYVDPVSKRRLRKLAFVSTGVRLGFTRSHAPFLVTTENAEHVAIFAVVSNSRYYGGRFGVTPMADPTDGVLDAVLFTARGRASLALFWLGVPSGLHLKHPNMVYLRTRRVEMRPLKEDDTVWFQTDGELAGRLPAVVEIEQQALRVLVP